MSEEHKYSVAELEAMLAAAKAEAAHEEYPKHVQVHESHVERRASTDGSPDMVAVPAFPDFEVLRDGMVMVLVRDADEEARATAEAVKAEPAVEEAATEQQSEA